MLTSDQNKENKPAGAPQSGGDSAIQGRVENSANEQFKAEEQKADISHVDRQEGTMHNGALGGNFSIEEA